MLTTWLAGRDADLTKVWTLVHGQLGRSRPFKKRNDSLESAISVQDRYVDNL